MKRIILTLALLGTLACASTALGASEARDHFQTVKLHLRAGHSQRACTRTIPADATVIASVMAGGVLITHDGQAWSTSLWVSGNDTMAHVTTTNGTSPICMRAMSWDRRQTVTLTVDWQVS